MAIARSRLTTRGEALVPAEVRRRLGLAPGSVLEWDEQAGQIVVRRAGGVSSEEIHEALFTKTPRVRTAGEMKEGLRQHIRRRHGRR